MPVTRIVAIQPNVWFVTLVFALNPFEPVLDAYTEVDGCLEYLWQPRYYVVLPVASQS